MDNLQLLVDFYKNAERQGPGSEETTLKALSFVQNRDTAQKILDIGCGTGASTMALLQHTKADVTAIDTLDDFLDVFRENARVTGYSDRLNALNMSMDAMTFAPQSFDILWAEGSIYHIGFEVGLNYFKPFLKSGGYLAVSEITWLTDERPPEVENYWTAAYPQIGTVADKLKAVANAGYDLAGHFPLPESCWTDHYYGPLVRDSEAFLARHGNSEEARSFINEFLNEVDTYTRYHRYYSYGFYILRKG